MKIKKDLKVIRETVLDELKQLDITQDSFENIEDLSEIVACNFAVKLLDRQMKLKG